VLLEAALSLTWGLVNDAGAPVRRAVQQGQAHYGLVELEGRRRVLVLVMPVLSPQTSAPAGFILAEFDPDAALEGLPLRSGLTVALAAVARPVAEGASAAGLLRAGMSVRAGQQPLQVELAIQVSRSLWSVLWFTFGIAALMGVLGLWLVSRLRGWAQSFASGTTAAWRSWWATARTSWPAVSWPCNSNRSTTRFPLCSRPWTACCASSSTTP
jgi:hypothetical protein